MRKPKRRLMVKTATSKKLHDVWRGIRAKFRQRLNQKGPAMPGLFIFFEAVFLGGVIAPFLRMLINQRPAQLFERAVFDLPHAFLGNTEAVA